MDVRSEITSDDLFLVKLLRAFFVDMAGNSMERDINDSLFKKITSHDHKFLNKTSGVAHTVREFEGVRDFFTSASMVAFIDLVLHVWHQRIGQDVAWRHDDRYGWEGDPFLRTPPIWWWHHLMHLNLREEHNEEKNRGCALPPRSLHRRQRHAP